MITSSDEARSSEGAFETDDDRFHRWFMWLTIALAVFVLWLRPLASSFWLDEFGTWWVIKDGLRETVSRSFEIQGQSPAFYLLAWTVRQLAGTQEWILRLPSVAFAATSAVLLYRLSRRLVDDELGRIVVLGVVVWPTVKFAAVDFRPYSLALLLVIASTVTLVAWLDSSGRWRALAYVVFMASTVYIHYVFGLVILAHIAYVIARHRHASTRVSVRSITAVALGIVLLIAPLSYQVLSLWRRREDWDIGTPVTVGWLASVVLPAAFVCAAAVAAVLVLVHLGVPRVVEGMRSDDLLLLVSWAFLPLIALIAVSIVTSASLVQDRYALVSAPAIIILLGLGLRSVQPASARRFVAVALAIASIFALGNAHQAGDWRGAVGIATSRVDAGSVVLVQSGFTESAQPSWLNDPERRSFLLSPTSFYPLAGEVLLLPQLSPALRDEARSEITHASTGANRVILLTNTGETAYWVLEVLGSKEWRLEPLPTGDSPFVFEIDRVTP